MVSDQEIERRRRFKRRALVRYASELGAGLAFGMWFATGGLMGYFWMLMTGLCTGAYLWARS